MFVCPKSNTEVNGLVITIIINYYELTYSLAKGYDFLINGH